jgi:sugar lactone lactonase YvrE
MRLLSRSARFVVLMFACAPALVAQSIFTYAGGGTTDGMQAKAVGLVGPRGVALDARGNLYIAEHDGNTVQRVNLATGIIERFAGNGGGSFSGDDGAALRASLKQPWSIVFDDKGNLFIADTGNSRVRRVDAVTGVITTFAGGGEDSNPDKGEGGPATKAFLRDPVALAWRDGELYLTDAGYDRHLVRKVDKQGNIITLAGTYEPGFAGDDGQATAAKLDTPLGMALDAAGNIYIADSANDRIRKIDVVTKKITTVAGGGSPADGIGDGPAAGAKLEFPTGLAFDKSGGLLIADRNHGRIRRYDPATGKVETIAGNGGYSEGDGGPATDAGLNLPYGVTVDAAGNIFFQDSSTNSIRRVDAQTKIITTVAGGGSYIGDGKVASSAVLLAPRGLTFDKNGNLLIADSNHTLIRKVDKTTGVISTFAGQLGSAYVDNQDGLDRREARVGYVFDLAVDKAGNLYAADMVNQVIWLIGADDKISRYAGGNQPDGHGDGDNGLATTASFIPRGIGVDAAGNVYIADWLHQGIRRIDASTKIITTVAGNGTEGFGGDGARATAAMLASPEDVVVDRGGNLYIADRGNAAIRRVDTGGIITTVAGREPDDTKAIDPAHMTIDPNNDDLYFADGNGYHLRKLDASTHAVTTLAGAGIAYYDTDFAGDNGPAISAKLNFAFDVSGVAMDAGGNLYIADTTNDRVRVVNACVAVASPQRVEPADGAAGTSTAPVLKWSRVEHALRYDLLLDTVNPPLRVVASDLSDTSFAPANLQPATKYFWSVVAKGDPFCPTPSRTPSTVSSFTTSGSCAAGTFDTVSPAEASVVSNATVLLSWQASSGAATYDVYIGPVNPPPLAAQGIAATQFSTTVGTGRYYWFVVAHAACDSTETTSTPVHFFDSMAAVNCQGATQVTLLQPAAGATSVATSVDLTWSANNLVTGYDLYFGTANTPPLLSSNLAATHQIVTGLTPGVTYFWRVVAQSPCNQQPVSSATASFTTRACATPGTPSILFAPAVVSAGSTYSLVWSVPAGVDSEGGYLVERSLNAAFSSVLDAQVVTSAAASFVAGNAGTLFHRVRALPGCDPSKSGTPSDVKSVVVTAAKPNVIFTTQPASVVTTLGERLEERRGSFTLENIGTQALQVIVGRQELNGSAPFFTIFDPRGEDSAFVTLDPHQPRTFELRYSGPANNVAGSYQGVVFVAATGPGLAVTPYAFVNLRVGAGGSGAAPQFVSNGTATDYAAFPGFSGEDANRPPLQVSIRNSGTAPMELAAEIGPEVWLVPEANWNATPIAPAATRNVNLFTRRSRAPNGSPLPRYTYFTVRTRDGASARLLVQDNPQATVNAARATRLEPDARSFIVPEVVSRLLPNGNSLVTRLRLSNVGSDAVQVELIYTPAGSDGFDSTVRRSTVVVPPNDVVTLTDPLVKIVGAAVPADGQLEVRVPRERLGLIGVTSSTVTLGGSGASTIPVVNRGEGARLGGTKQLLFGITASATQTTTLIFDETTGTDGARVIATLFDGSGAQIGQPLVNQLKAYGHLHLSNAVSLFGGNAVDAGRIELAVDNGSGSVIGMAIVGPPASANGATYLSRPSDNSSAGKGLMAYSAGKPSPGPTIVSIPLATIIPVLGAPTSAGATPAYQTMATFVAPGSLGGMFTATFRRSGGLVSPVITFPLAAGGTKQVGDLVLLFGLPANTQGGVYVQGPSGSKVSAVLNFTAPAAGAPVLPAGVLPLISSASEAITSAAALAKRPLFYDGLDQSIDPTRGSRWMLALDEVGGAGGTVNVRLYEAGNRSIPVAEKEVSIIAYQHLQLDTVFSTLGLDADDRRKDRTNVQCVVTASTGTAQIAASLLSIDNQTGETRVFPMVPVSGSASPSISVVTPVNLQLPGNGKKRSVRH